MTEPSKSVSRDPPRRASPTERIVGLALILLLAGLVTAFLRHIFQSPEDANGSDTAPYQLEIEDSYTARSFAHELSPASDWRFPLLARTGWTSPSTVARYDADTLFVKINGRDEFYLRLGFQELLYGRYEFAPGEHGSPDARSAADIDAPAAVDVYIYVMGAPGQARRAFELEKPPVSKQVSLGDEGYEAGGAVFFLRSACYVQILPASADPEPRAAALLVARQLADAPVPR